MLNNRWYPVLEAERVQKKPSKIRRFGKNWVLWRDASGSPHMLPAACPHRGASLAQGRVVDGEIECPWHGFRFGTDGRCTSMPCEGEGAAIPKAMHLTPLVVREAHELVWAWWGDEREHYPEIPFFDHLGGLTGSTQTSYILPYHYSRMVETNLDIHHTPFVHGNVIPVGARMHDFDAHRDGDRILSTGSLVREKNAHKSDAKGVEFSVEMVLPNLITIALSPRLHIVVCATPVDDEHSWLWFRYCQSYTSLAALGKLITWFSVQSELRVVQKQDWRVFAEMTPGTIDDFPYAFVHADKAIALYRKLRLEKLADEKDPLAQASIAREQAPASAHHQVEAR
jgi:phenylpropionate dioxygenase-like ring-hydroxylating dioxygenase large terminal subunit